jgi:hypothetical protein
MIIKRKIKKKKILHFNFVNKIILLTKINQTVSLDTNHFIQAEAQTNQTVPLGGHKLFRRKPKLTKRCH